MTITGEGWEILIERTSNQLHPITKRERTVGTYKVYHDGNEMEGLSGTTAEAPGLGDNSSAGINLKRIESGRYPLGTQKGKLYSTLHYSPVDDVNTYRMPGIELRKTEAREEILIHPGKDAFLSSVGCINLCTKLPDASELISFHGSRRRVIALIEDMKAYFKDVFPSEDEEPIDGAWAVIVGDP